MNALSNPVRDHQHGADAARTRLGRSFAGEQAPCISRLKLGHWSRSIERRRQLVSQHFVRHTYRGSMQTQAIDTLLLQAAFLALERVLDAPAPVVGNPNPQGPFLAQRRGRRADEHVGADQTIELLGAGLLGIADRAPTLAWAPELGVCAAEGVEAKRVGKEPNSGLLLRTVAVATAGKTGSKWDSSPPVAADALLPRRLLVVVRSISASDIVATDDPLDNPSGRPMRLGECLGHGPVRDQIACMCTQAGEEDIEFALVAVLAKAKQRAHQGSQWHLGTSGEGVRVIATACELSQHLAAQEVGSAGLVMLCKITELERDSCRSQRKKKQK